MLVYHVAVTNLVLAGNLPLLSGLVCASSWVYVHIPCSPMLSVSKCYCKFGNFCEGFIFAKLGEITLSFTYEGKSCHTREFLRRKYVF